VRPPPAGRQRVGFASPDPAQPEQRLSPAVGHVAGHVSKRRTRVRKAIAEQVDMPATVLYTDEGVGCRTFEREFAAHKTVNHSAEEYVPLRGRRGHHQQPGGELLLAVEAVDRRHPPPRLARAPEPLPRRVRLPVLDAQRAVTLTGCTPSWPRRAGVGSRTSVKASSQSCP
jgi:hypothetical protein